MKLVTVTCDNCGNDLTISGNSVDWRIALINEPIPHSAGVVTDMMIYPHMKADAFFCGRSCLKQFVAAL